MIEDPQGTVLAVFAAFCRVGGCIMVLPGFSSFRVPVQVRLFLALGLSMALTPLLWDIQNTPDGIQGRIEMEVRGGEVEYTVSYDYTAGTSEPFIEMACLESDDAEDETVTDAR